MSRSLLMALAVCSSALAQGGPMTSFSQAMSTPGMGAPILIKLAGDQTGNPPFPIPPDIPGVPDFNLDSMFGSLAPFIDIDAMSTGNDVFPINPATNEVAPFQDSWVAMAFSVDQNALGEPGSTIADRALPANPAGPGADTRTFYFEGSDGIGPGLVGETLMPTTAEQAGFAGATPEEVDAVDFFLPLIIMNDGGSSLFAPSTLDFYFSVTSASLPFLPLSFFTPEPQKSGAHILRMTWTGTAWTPPSVYRSAASLGLSVSDDVDALGVWAGQVVYSTTNPSDPPLLTTNPGPVSAEVLRQGGIKIPPGIKITTGDDLDAFCGFDPEVGYYSYWLGVPEDSMGLDGEMLLSAARHKWPGVANQDRVELVVTGWGGAAPAAGTMVFEHLVNGVWLQLWSEPRAATQSVFTTRVLQLPSPPGLSLDVRLRARFVPAGSGYQATSYTVGMKI